MNILLPNKYSASLNMGFIRCQCGEEAGQRRDAGFLDTHFLPVGHGRPPQPQDMFLPGTSLCRYSGRSITLAAAIERDSRLTDNERLAKSQAAHFNASLAYST